MLLVLLIPGLINSGMRNIHPNSLPVGRAESVGGVDPAVGVHDPRGDALHDAVDPVADELVEGGEERGHQEDGERRPVVQPERRVVDDRLLEAKVRGEPRER